MQATEEIKFDIHCKEDFFSMQKLLNSKNDVSVEKRYIALELAENIIEAKEKGSIIINGVNVESIIHDFNEDKYTEAESYIQKAKEAFNEQKTSNIKVKNNFGGRGFLTILYAGWNIEIHKESTGFRITANKSVNA